MEDYKIINPFDDYPPQQQSAVPPGSGSTDSLANLQQLSAGNGNKVMRFDQRGLWLGAADPTAAPFFVDLGGNITAKSFTALNIVLTNNGLPQIVIGSF